jgi:hypothetical protein
MKLDSVLEEVRTIRDQIAREHDYDINAIFEVFREWSGKPEWSARW